MNDLPAEVYYHIFAAVQVYSKELIIDDYKVQLAKCYLASYDPSKLFQNGYLVRKLIFKSKYGDGVERFRGTRKASDNKIPSGFSFSQAEFSLLLKYFPNIQEIDLTECGNFTNYISFLFDANLQYIKKIKALTFEQYFGTYSYYEYVSTCLKFCGTLTSLFLEYTEDTKDYTFCGVGILDMLSQFENLKQLEFRSNYSDNSIMFRIQELCPKLTDLTFTSNLSCSEGDVQDLLEQRVEHTVKSNKSLRYLDINLPSLPIDYTKYLTSYLEDTLHTVNIQVRFTGLYDWIEDVGMEDTLKLMKKLGQLNDVRISFARTSRLRRTRLTYELKMAKWFQVVNAFKGNKKALCTVKLCGTSPSRDYFKYNALDNQLILAYTLEDVDYRRLENADYNVYYNEREDADYYEREDIGYYEREDVYYDEREYDIHIYRSYETLSESAFPASFISTIGPEIIDRLELNLEKVSDNFVTKFLEYYLKVTDYFQIQGRSNHRNEELNSIRNNLKMVHFLSGTSTNNILNIIFKYLPDIEVLVLGNHNLTLFKSLKRCYALNIKFDYTDGKKRRYYYDVREDIQRTIRLCRSFIFTCKKDTEFTVCFGSDESLLNFNIDKNHDSRYRIPIGFI
ncbi:hypothetical protein EDC94DRAFT_609038 [Helicostylum pulchrum]|nr:hypothetical protein EDC94DRAFT_609038 [Helicostylum pulchrum]